MMKHEEYTDILETIDGLRELVKLLTSQIEEYEWDNESIRKGLFLCERLLVSFVRSEKLLDDHSTRKKTDWDAWIKKHRKLLGLHGFPETELT